MSFGADSLDAGVLAEFDSPEAMLAAVRRLREAGYSRLDTFSPFAVPGAEEALGLERPRLPAFVLAGGLLGAIFAAWVMWWANARDYPLNVGGRPLFSWPAYVPIAFENAVLFASLTAFVGLLLFIGLPRLWHPLFEIPEWERTSVDRYWVGIDRRDPRYEAERSAADLYACEPLRVVRLEAE